MKRVRKIVEERKTAREEEKGGAARDAVDVLLGDEELSVEAISENIIEMMIPGEETLPTSMTMAVKFLSDSPPALSHLRVYMIPFFFPFFQYFTSSSIYVSLNPFLVHHYIIS